MRYCYILCGIVGGWVGILNSIYSWTKFFLILNIQTIFGHRTGDNLIGKPTICIDKNKSFTVTAKLSSAFVFATWIVQFLYFLNTCTKFWAYSHLLCFYSSVCVQPVQKPHFCFFFIRRLIVVAPNAMLFLYFVTTIWGQKG